MCSPALSSDIIQNENRYPVINFVQIHFTLLSVFVKSITTPNHGDIIRNVHIYLFFKKEDARYFLFINVFKSEKASGGQLILGTK